MPGIEEQLRRDLLELFALLHERKVSYLLVGGIAMLTYVEGRNTQDVDLVLSVASLEGMPEIKMLDRSRDFARGIFGKLRVDVLLTTNPVFKLVQEQHAATHVFLETSVRCATVDGLLILKLYPLPSLYRQGDGPRIGLYENDIFMLCDRYRPDMEPLFGAIGPYVEADAMRELRNIAADIEARVERVDRLRQPPGSP